MQLKQADAINVPRPSPYGVRHCWRLPSARLESRRMLASGDDVGELIYWSEPAFDDYDPFRPHGDKPVLSRKDTRLYLAFAALAGSPRQRRVREQEILAIHRPYGIPSQKQGLALAFAVSRLLAPAATQTRAIIDFVRQWGVPETPTPEEFRIKTEFGEEPYSGAYPILRFQYLVYEMAYAIGVWRALQEGEPRRIARAADLLLLVRGFRPARPPFYVSSRDSHFSPGHPFARLGLAATSIMSFSNWRSRYKLARERALEALHWEVVGERLQKTGLDFTYSVRGAHVSFAQFWAAEDLLSAMWTMFYLDIIRDSRIAYCQCCDEPYLQVRDDMRYKPGHRERAKKRRQRARQRERRGMTGGEEARGGKRPEAQATARGGGATTRQGTKGGTRGPADVSRRHLRPDVHI